MDNVYIITYYKPYSLDKKCNCEGISFTYVVGKKALDSELEFRSVNGCKNIRWHKISKKTSGSVEKSFENDENIPIDGVKDCFLDIKLESVDILRGEMLKTFGSKITTLAYDRLIRKIQGGDEIWKIKCKDGKSGYVILRNGLLVDKEIH